MRVGDSLAPVGPGDAIAIPPNTTAYSPFPTSLLPQSPRSTHSSISKLTVNVRQMFLLAEGIHRVQPLGDSRLRFDSSLAVYRFLLLGSSNVQVLRGRGKNALPRDSKGQWSAFATVLIAFGLLASWSWHHHHGTAMLGSSATISPAVVSGSVEPTGAGRVVPHRQPVCRDSDFGGTRRCDIARCREHSCGHLWPTVRLAIPRSG